MAAVAVAAALWGGACSREPERSTASFCREVAGVQGLDQVLAGGDAAGARDQVDRMRTLQAAAPGDIEPQVATLVAITDELSHALGTATDADAAAATVFARHRDETADITAAGAAVERYAATNCGITLNPSGTVTATTPGGGVPGATNAIGPTGTGG